MFKEDRSGSTSSHSSSLLQHDSIGNMSYNKLDFMDVVRNVPIAEKFLQAAEDGNTEQMAYALGSLHKMDKVDEIRDRSTGQTAWHVAAAQGLISVLWWMENNGGEPDVEDADGCTAAHFAAAGGHVEALQWLKAHGHNLTLQDNRCFTPEDYAAMNNKEAVLGFLLKLGKAVFNEISALPGEAPPCSTVVFSPTILHSNELYEAVLSLFLGETHLYLEDKLPWRIPPPNRAYFANYNGSVKVSGGILLLGGVFQLECHPFVKEGYSERVVVNRSRYRQRSPIKHHSPMSPGSCVSLFDEVRGGAGSEDGSCDISLGGETLSSSESVGSSESEEVSVYSIICTTLQDQSGSLLLQTFRYVPTGGCFVRLIPLTKAVHIYDHVGGRRLSGVPVSNDGAKSLRPISAKYEFASVEEKKEAVIPVFERNLVSERIRTKRPNSCLRRVPSIAEAAKFENSPLLEVFTQKPTEVLAKSLSLITRYLQFLKRGSLCRKLFAVFRESVVRVQSFIRIVCSRKQRAVLKLMKQWHTWQAEVAANLSEKLRVASYIQDPELLALCQKETEDTKITKAEKLAIFESKLVTQRETYRDAAAAGFYAVYKLDVPLSEVILHPSTHYKVEPELLAILEDDSDISETHSDDSAWTPINMRARSSVHRSGVFQALANRSLSKCSATNMRRKSSIAFPSDFALDGVNPTQQHGLMLGQTIIGDWSITEEVGFSETYFSESSDSDVSAENLSAALPPGEAVSLAPTLLRGHSQAKERLSSKGSSSDFRHNSVHQPLSRGSQNLSGIWTPPEEKGRSPGAGVRASVKNAPKRPSPRCHRNMQRRKRTQILEASDRR